MWRHGVITYTNLEIKTWISNFCVMFCRSMFVLLLSAITLFVLRFKASDYPFGIFKLFFSSLGLNSSENKNKIQPVSCWHLLMSTSSGGHNCISSFKNVTKQFYVESENMSFTNEVPGGSTSSCHPEIRMIFLHFQTMLWVLGFSAFPVSKIKGFVVWPHP